MEHSSRLLGRAFAVVLAAASFAACARHDARGGGPSASANGKTASGGETLVEREGPRLGLRRESVRHNRAATNGVSYESDRYGQAIRGSEQTGH